METCKIIEKLIEKHLESYLSTLFKYSINSLENVITILGRRDQNDTADFILLRMQVIFDNRELLISNIFIPKEDRKNGIGLGLIEFIFKIAKELGFNLALVDMVDSFRNRMLLRGAIETKYYDCLQIVDTTNLK